MQSPAASQMWSLRQSALEAHRLLQNDTLLPDHEKQFQPVGQGVAVPHD
jgi:hypothetical protein